LAGHTHRDHSSRYVGRTLYTQADYFGIHCGRVDLSFDVDSRRLLERRAYTVLMDERIEGDPLVLETAAKDLEDAATYVGRVIGELAVELANQSPASGKGSPLQHLIAASILHAAAQHGVAPDGVFHGTFGSGTLAAGKKTIGDVWEILPYDNGLVALSLTREELVAVLNESLQSTSDRALFGFDVEVADSEAAKGEVRGSSFVRSLTPRLSSGPKPAGNRYRIVFNSYDAQSGGKRLMRLRSLAQHLECDATVIPPTSRQVLVDFFVDREVVRAADLRPGAPKRGEPTGLVPRS
jgi:2',3'-cyclic-nucleotide 2'-phosphodiesterase/3'-nucleotidase